MNDIILSTQNGEPVASSRDVAKRFGKEHKNVMQAVANLVAENSAAKSMFHPATFENRGKKYPLYLMNRDGFSLLAMGFTGKEAVQWKLKYIEAFNQMEKQLAAQHKEQQAVQDANIQNAIDRVIEARKKLDENTAFLDECRKNREDSKAKYMQVKALCGEFKAIYGQHCDTVRTMENVVRGSQSFLTNAIDSLTIVAKGYPFYAALMDSLLDGLPAEKKEE
jgi:Rha family phage regulatory protein|nr:MAG TPA: regulatory protein [Caudoviricetes sp.]